MPYSKLEVFVFSMKTIFSAIMGCLVALSTGSAHASLILAYDSPTLQLASGQSIQIGATLTNTSSSGVFTTDGNGIQTIAPLFESTFTVGEQYTLLVIIVGQPDPSLAHYSQFVVNVPNPMANLNIVAGSSSHLILGTLTIDPTTPAGLFTGLYGIDIGIYEAQSFPCTGVCTVNGDPFAPPTIDAGTLSVNVTSVPEPSTFALISLVVGGMAWRRLRVTLG
jgi:hypothetical protein